MAPLPPCFFEKPRDEGTHSPTLSLQKAERRGWGTRGDYFAASNRIEPKADGTWKLGCGVPVACQAM
jgi:hypothetical protein